MGAQEDAFVKRVNEEIVKIQDGLHIEQKTREDSENSLIKVLEVCAKRCRTKYNWSVKIVRVLRRSSSSCLKRLVTVCNQASSHKLVSSCAFKVFKKFFK